GYEYTRFGNPNRHVLESVAASLDGAEYCLAYSSGMGAILNICHLLKTGDTIICMDEVYEGTRALFEEIEKRYYLKVIFVDCTNPENLEAAITPETKLVWLETPTNPTLTVIDIRACAEVAHRHPGVLVAVDNSFMSPYFQRPLSLGADICMSSATKYINGHSDVLMGLVSVNRDDLYKRLKFLQYSLGAVPSPFDCFLCNRGLKTLHIRMKLHFHNGLAVAKFLESHPRVEKVIYPGLPSHPQYEVMQRQCTGVSGMVSFYIKGEKENAIAFLENLRMFTLGFSLGGYESLAEHPATMSHAFMPEDVKKALGITDTLIRLSVGLEDEEDLLADLDQALKAAVSGVFPSK
ncbi:CGL lyase, partial [Falcunculus frontatus]|nr:CGL lyase [Falcunculus frontatus]